MQSSSLEFLTSLVAAPSPSGYEQPVARLYRDYTAPFADQVTTDVAGNVMAVLNPDAPMKVMLAGHMDEIGFIIHHIGDDGLWTCLEEVESSSMKDEISHARTEEALHPRVP